MRKFTSKVIDEHIGALNKEIMPLVDCVNCANCCKKLEPGLEVEEIAILASLKQEEITVFKQKHIAFDGTAFYLKTKPCMFLNDCLCSIYTYRPAACSGYPHLNQIEMKHRKSFWENYSVCPIVFNVIERLNYFC